MVSQTPPISASLVTLSSSEIPFDKGVVDKQIDPSTYIIRVPSGDITVRVPEGALTVGDSVSIASQGDEVYIAIHSYPVESYTAFGDTLELQIGPKMEELLSLLKNLQGSLSSDQNDTYLSQLLDSAIEFFEQKKHDISSLQLLLAQLKNEIILKLDTTQTPGNQEATYRIAELLTALSEKLSALSGGGKGLHAPVVVLTESPETGFYYVKNADEALSMLTRYSPEAENSAKEMLKIFTDKPLFLLFYESAAGGKKAIAMPREQAVLEIEHMLRVDMKSEIMKQLDPKLIADMIIQKGNLNMSQMFDLDNLLHYVSTDNKSSFVHGDALSISLPQLVAVALEAGDTKIPDFHTALMLVGSRIPDLVSTILTWLETQRDDLKMVDLKNVLFKSFSADHITHGKKEEAIPSLFRNTGFTLEHDLYSSAQGEVPLTSGLQKDSPSFKLALLLILGYLNTLTEQNKNDGAEGKGAPERSLQTRMTPDGPSDAMKPSAEREHEGPPIPRMATEVVRQQIETVLGRLESLQMLAKPVVSADGEQQVLVLPVHIGDEWSEIRVKFIKEHRGRKKGKPAEHITVMLNMELSILGEITAFMEYHTGKSLQVSLTLEHAFAREWFQKYKNELNEALIALGIPVVQLKLYDKTVEKEKKPLAMQKKHGQQANFDVLG